MTPSMAKIMNELQLYAKILTNLTNNVELIKRAKHSIAPCSSHQPPPFSKLWGAHRAYSGHLPSKVMPREPTWTNQSLRFEQ